MTDIEGACGTVFSIIGRIGPRTFVLTVIVFGLLCFAVSVPVAFAAVLLGYPNLFMFLGGVGQSVWWFSAFTLSVRRLHDRGKSGWWLVLYYPVPLALAYLGIWMESLAGHILSLAGMAIFASGFIELLYLKGDSRPNMYGAVPVGR